MNLKRLAWLIFGLSVVLCVAALILIYFNPPIEITEGRGVRGYYIGMSLFVGALGLVILSRFPRHGIGWVFVTLGLMAALLAVIQEYTYFAVFARPDLPLGGETAAWTWHWIWIPATPLLILIPLYFPNGKLPAPGWKLFAWLLFGNSIVRTLAAVFQPGPLSTISSIRNPASWDGAAGLLTTLIDITGAIYVVVFITASLSLFLRYRHASGIERQQIKWLAFAVVLFALTSPMSSLPFPWYLFSSLAFIFIPITVVLAIFRYRLFDIDIIIRRTLVYSILAGILWLIYYGAVVFLQGIFRNLTGQESQFAIVLSTLAIAALFTPLQRRVQDLIDRRFYRRKYDAEQTLAFFNARARNEVSLEKMAGLLIETIDGTVKPEHVSLRLKK